jgi:hypothetical protein
VNGPGAFSERCLRGSVSFFQVPVCVEGIMKRISQSRPLFVELLENRLQPGSIIGLDQFGDGLAPDLDVVFSQDPLADQHHVSLTDAVQTSRSISSNGIATSNVARGAAGVENTGLVRGSAAAAVSTDLLAFETARAHVGRLISAIAAPQQVRLGGAPQHTAGVKTQPTYVGSPKLATPVVATVAASYTGHAVANLPTTAVHVKNGVGRQTTNPQWSRYVGTSAEDRLEGVAVNAPSTDRVYSSGWTGSPFGHDLLVTNVSVDGIDANQATIDMGGDATVDGAATAVAADGTQYVATTAAAGIEVVQISPDQSSASAFVFDNTAGGKAGGIKLDSSGTNLYVSGTTPDGNLFVASLTDLGSWPSPTVIYAAAISAENGIKGGNIAVNSAGIVVVGSTILRTTGDDEPHLIAFDGSTPIDVGGFVSVGPGNPNDGGRNGYGAFVDGNGDLYLGFSFRPDASSAFDLAGAKWDPSGTTLLGAGAYTFGTINGYGYSISADLSDPAHPEGIVYLSRVGNDLPDGGNMGFIKFLAENPMAFEDQGTAFGALDDQGRGIALNPSDPNLLRVYVAGFTNSTDFNFAVNSYQGGAYDGMLIGYTDDHV